MYNRREIFRKAWELARFHAKNYGGTVKSRFAMALRQAWRLTKEAVERVKNPPRIDIEKALGGPLIPNTRAPASPRPLSDWKYVNSWVR